MPWTLILNVIFKVLEWLLDYSKADKLAKKKFVAFVEEMANQKLTTVKLNEDYNELLDKLKKKRDAV